MNDFSPKRKPLPLKDNRKGFALVLALALMSLVFLLVISLVSLVGTDLSLAELRKQRVLSQANAKMGMMVAIGELQKHLGPDTRISGTADLLDERIESTDQFLQTKYDPSITPTEGIDLNENGEIDKLPFGQRYWTGVWKHKAANSNDKDNPGISPSPMNFEPGNSASKFTSYDSGFDSHPAVEVAWLVSGNEGYQKKLGIFSSSGPFGDSLSEFLDVPDGIFVDDRSSPYGTEPNAWLDFEKVVKTDKLLGLGKNLTERSYHHPLITLPDPDLTGTTDSNETVWILKNPLLKHTYDKGIRDGSVKPEDWRNHLIAEPVKVRKTSFALSEKEDKPAVYAYWVADEGVKAKLNLLSSNTQKQVAESPNITTGFDLGFAHPEKNQTQVIDASSFAVFDQSAITSDDTKNVRNDKISANFHSLTADSFGVLSDSRSGGLRRDLSALFGMPDQQFDEYGFGGWFYKERVHYLKEFEPNLKVVGASQRPHVERPGGVASYQGEPIPNPNSKAKANQWLDRAGAPYINDYGVLAAGPKWSVLRDFHNLYENVDNDSLTVREPTGGEPSNAYPDKFPRSTGDNLVVFDKRPYGAISNARGGAAEIRKQYNYLRGIQNRPEPSNHPISPVLLEIKYGQAPFFENGKLGLAVLPSVAFWNPYDVTLTMEQDIIVEVPIQNEIQAYNTKDWDIFKKWWNHELKKDSSTSFNGFSSSSSSLPSSSEFNFDQPDEALLASIWPPTFIDLNGNGRWDPGESGKRPPKFPPVKPGRPGGGGGGGGPRPPWRRPIYTGDREDFWRKQFKDVRHQERGMMSNPDHRTFFRFRNESNFTPLFGHTSSIRSNGRIPVFHIFRQSRIELQPGRSQFVRATGAVPLRLRISGLKLAPGEKAHFTVGSGATYDWNLISQVRNDPSGRSKSLLDIPLVKGPEIPVIAKFFTDYTQPGSDPITVRHWLSHIKGISRAELENIDDKGNILPGLGGTPSPRGITLYLASGSSEFPIKKFSKSFQIGLGAGLLDYANANSDLGLSRFMNLSGNKAPMNGFRLRWKLPGNSNKIVFHEFNPRSLVESFQTGSGHNWSMETFFSTNFKGGGGNKACNTWTSFYGGQMDDGTTYQGRERPPYRWNVHNPTSEPFADFDDFNITKHFTSSSTTGGSFVSGACFPLVDGSGEYCIGHFHEDQNLDMEPQVAFDSAIMFGVPRSPLLSLVQFRHANLNPYSQGPAYIVGNSYATTQVARYKTWGRVRRIDFQPDMNIPFLINKFSFEYLDQFTGNYFPVRLFPWDLANLDTGAGTVRDVENEFNHQNVTLDQSYYANQALFDGYFLSGDDRNSPSPSSATQSANPRLIPYQNPDGYGIAQLEEDHRHQTNASNLLLNGAFNVNSTSVEAWLSQLSSLKEYGENKVPFPRVIGESSSPEDVWSGYASLTDDQLEDLARYLVEEVKLRGPFLSLSDFVNRRVARTSFASGNESLVWLPRDQWPRETRDTVLGLRGPVQAAIAKAGVNGAGFSTSKEDMALPRVPEKRYIGPARAKTTQEFYYVGFKSNGTTSADSKFGTHAISLQRTLQSAIPKPSVANPDRNRAGHWFSFKQGWGAGVTQKNDLFPDPNINVRATRYHIDTNNAFRKDDTVANVGDWIPTPPILIPAVLQDPPNPYRQWTDQQGMQVSRERMNLKMDVYKNAFNFGEAPDSLLAVENVATGANIPGWLTQADVLSPLAPSLAARSDTFTIRVMGESPAGESNQMASRSWIEVTVQRLPDYVKSKLDPAHHRPHEPFEDRNFDGIWNDRSEYWLDLNRNSTESDSSGKIQPITNGIEAGPDLPGVGDTGARDRYAVGLPTDRKLNQDPHEEDLSNSDKDISRKGINQRFGRKFKIIKFRWLRENEV
jgi:hypothetical protein